MRLKSSSTILKTRKKDYRAQILYKMDHASQICRDASDAARVIRYGIDAIRRERACINSLARSDGESASKPDVPLESMSIERTAYIIRQIKRPAEITLLRQVYGKQFILLSAYATENDRRNVIIDKLKRSLSLTTSATKIAAMADDLIAKDAHEAEDDYGQHLRDAFHLADVFVDGLSKIDMKKRVSRFISALFGSTEITPNRVEFGMYAAKSASLRSADLSRQVGAAIFSENGVLLTQGCNEVPRAFGGTYWEGDEPDNRDVKLGHDPNDYLKREILRDILERLEEAKLLNSSSRLLGTTSDDIVTSLLSKPNNKKPDGHGCLNNSLIVDVTEYGRVVHAEMNAITDAARLGVSIGSAILFCTTFPCHNCTKHILAAGIKRVYYMEPYTKSRAKELHADEIELERFSRGLNH